MIVEIITVDPEINLIKLLEDYQANYAVQNISLKDDQLSVWFNQADHDSLTPEDFTAISVEATGQNDPNNLEVIRKEYKKFKKDGKKYHDDIHDILVKDVREATITTPEALGIELQLDHPLAKLRNGDWMTTQYRLSLITPAAPLTQEFYDEIVAFVATYITNNYPV